MKNRSIKNQKLMAFGGAVILVTLCSCSSRLYVVVGENIAIDEEGEVHSFETEENLKMFDKIKLKRGGYSIYSHHGPKRKKALLLL